MIDGRPVVVERQIRIADTHRDITYVGIEEIGFRLGRRRYEEADANGIGKNERAADRRALVVAAKAESVLAAHPGQIIADLVPALRSSLRRQRICAGAEKRVGRKGDLRQSRNGRVDSIVEIAEVENQVVAHIRSNCRGQTGDKIMSAVGYDLVIGLKDTADAVARHDTGAGGKGAL